MFIMYAGCGKKLELQYMLIPDIHCNNHLILRLTVIDCYKYFRSTGDSGEQRGGGHAAAAPRTPAPPRCTHKAQLQLITKPLHLHHQAHPIGQHGQANQSPRQQVTRDI